MIKRLVSVTVAGLLVWPGSSWGTERFYLPLTWASLLTLNQDWALAHEGKPDGVPGDYDWAQKPRLGAGNNPEGFTAFTGWGQVFSAAGSKLPVLSVSIRNMQVLVCHGPKRDWILLQKGEVEGGQFRPDYEANINMPPLASSHMSGTTSVQFKSGSAYHFWPKQGRVDLPRTNLCGILVVLQARTMVPLTQTAAPPSGLLLGLGADYWRDKGAPWDNYRSNLDVGIGRLKWVDASWRWFGMSTAAMDDLRKLYLSGYTLASPQAQ